MDKDLKKQLQKEKHFTGASFTEEILPLLADYFVGEFKLDQIVIICSFENGQKFKLKVDEI